MKNQCPKCFDGITRTETRRDISVKIDGLDFVIPEGTLEVCPNCGAETSSPEEYQRWKELVSKVMQDMVASRLVYLETMNRNLSTAEHLLFEASNLNRNLQGENDMGHEIQIAQEAISRAKKMIWRMILGS